MKTKTNLLTAGMLLTALASGFGQPVITIQPQNQTNLAGTTATFTVGATGAPPLSYQWRSYASSTAFTNIPWGTDSILLLTNGQSTTRRFGVVVSDVGGSVTSVLATLTVLVPPTITSQPRSQTVEVGESATLSAGATGTSPLHYQWRLNDENLAGKTNTSLALANLQFTNAGSYAVVVTNVAGSATSQVATLTVLPPVFTKITHGAIVNDGGFSFSCAWGDYDDDGFIDLFVANWGGSGINGGGFLYHNNRDGTFTRILGRSPVNNTVWLSSATWGDYDNDGFNDLYVTTNEGETDVPNFLYHNNGDGTFTLVTNITMAQQMQHSSAGVWGDFDNDGWLDLFVANFVAPGISQARDNILYQNDRRGDFKRFSFGTKPRGADFSFSAAWGDFDNDGFLDLAVPQGGYASRQQTMLYRNNRDGTLSLLTNSAVSADMLNGEGCAWGDYDNDGWLDLCVGNFYGENNNLFHNNRDGTFTKITNSIVALDGGWTKGIAWGDYDNDGWLDLFVSNLGSLDLNGVRAPNFLYHNNGDGTFTKITSGSVVKDLGNCGAAVWGDYDNDGFLDLFVANGFVSESANNRLYKNNGNSNSWLNLRLIGTVSNRSAIGAKVRVQAIIGGKTFWQLREISGGSGFGSQNDLRANFGLGDATNAGIVRIEWPSGTVQDLHDVAVRQFLTVTEPPRLEALGDSTNGSFQLALTSWAGLTHSLDTSSNLTEWMPWQTVTATNRTTQIEDPASHEPQRFYRARPVN